MHRRLDKISESDGSPGCGPGSFWYHPIFFYEWMLSKQETPLSDKVNPLLEIFLKGVKLEVAG